MLPLLLGAGLAGWLLGKNRKTQTVGRAQPTRAMLKERERRVVSMAAFHQAKRQGLKAAIAVATAKAVYQAKGGKDIAFIARLESMDPEFLGIGATLRERHKKKKAGHPPKRKPHTIQRYSTVKPQPRFEEPQEEEEEPQQAPQAAPPAAAPGKAQPQPDPEPEEEAPEEADEEPDDETNSQQTAAKAFVRMLDNGKDVAAAREKAKAVYQAMSPQPDAAFLKRIEGWSEA